MKFSSLNGRFRVRAKGPMKGLPSSARPKILACKSVMLGIMAVLAVGAAYSEEYPTKTVKIVVPFAPGGGTDTMARVVANGLQKAFGQSFIVDNRPGASGNIGLEQVAKSPADGYTLVMITSNLAINPSLFERVGYHPIKDFAPIALVGSSPVAISVHPDTGFRNLADLIRYAKANPGKLSYTSCGAGTPQHLAAELLSQMAKIEMLHVSYKGCAQAIPDHISGTAPVSFSTIANLSPHLKSGKVHGIGVTGAKRSPYAPDIPTVSEAAGLNGYDIDVWFGLFAPAGTPKPVIAKLNRSINETLANADVKQRMTDQSYQAIGGTPEFLGELVKRDMARYEGVIRKANIKPD
jgi:tripartite-type tricarboxylate transporter receptor subunit TctC